jgi:DNA-binding transcriptional ArsR family regulator
MPKDLLPYVIHDRKQMVVLKASARQEILDTLASMGAISISELALALGRPADGLYYHIRILQKAGLVRAAGTRGKGTRAEALFRAASPDLRLAYEPGPKGNAKSVTAIVDSMLRLTSRDFEDAYQSKETVVEGEQRELWATRTTGWLTAKQVAEVNHHIAALIRTTAASSPNKGRLFAITTVLAPLQRSATRESTGNPRQDTKQRSTQTKKKASRRTARVR